MTTPNLDEALEIAREPLDAMVAHCLRDAPNEACGILGGVGRSANSIHPLRNVKASPVRYDADPKEIIAAVVSLRNRGAEIVAIYHSHPRHAAIPSRTDLDENHYGDVPRIIVSLLGEEPIVRAWRLGKDEFDEVPWRVAVEGDDRGR